AFEKGNTAYALRADYTTGKKKTILMHRVIMNAAPGQEIDHIDRNGWNNTKENLRISTRKGNCTNQGLRRDNKTGFRGVYWKKQYSKWFASIRNDRKQIHLGYFSDPVEAARAYDAAAREYHGDFASLNFPEEVAS